MQVDSVSNNIQSLTSAQAGTLEKLGSGLSINSASDNSSALSISEQLGSQRSTISQAIENLNSGIAMSNIAQGGISQQKNILSEVKTLTLQAMNGTTSSEGKQAISDQITKFMEQFSSISEGTNYNGEKLLSEDAKDLSIVTNEGEFIDMESSDTKSVGDAISLLIGNMSNPDDMKALLSALDGGMDQLAQMASKFAASSSQMESSARSEISAQTSLAQSQSILVDADFSKEVSNFSKSNIQVQIGLMAATQANAVQQRNVALLS